MMHWRTGASRCRRSNELRWQCGGQVVADWLRPGGEDAEHALKGSLFGTVARFGGACRVLRRSADDSLRVEAADCDSV